MSTVYGLAASVGQPFLLCTVDTSTGAWSQVGVPITLSPANPDLVPCALMWNPDDLTMYMAAVNVVNGPTTSLYTLDLLTQVATFLYVIDANTSISNGFIKGLSYDTINNEVYCICERDFDFSLNTTYRLDLPTGDLTLLGTPAFDDVRHVATLITDTFELYGLGITESTLPPEYQMFTIDPGDGTWTPTSSETGYLPVSAMVSGIPRGEATTYDATAGRAYGAITIDADGVQIITAVIDLMSGSWTQIGAAGILNPQAMTVVENICVAANTQVALIGGQQKLISEIQEGDIVVDCQGRPARVERNVMTGHARQFVQIPKNAFGVNQPSDALLIRKGHPVLLKHFQVPCEALIGQFGIEDVKLSKDVAIFTLITEQQTFVQMNGVSVGTWSPESFRASFLKN